MNVWREAFWVAMLLGGVGWLLWGIGVIDPRCDIETLRVEVVRQGQILAEGTPAQTRDAVLETATETQTLVRELCRP